MIKKVLSFFIILFTLSPVTAKTHNDQQTWQTKLWGTATPPSLLLGMWTTHLWTNEFGALQANNLIGFAGYGLFAGTFTNSYTHRSYAAGINRYWWTKEFSPNTQLQIGYRLGLIYGYKKGEVLFSSHSPVIPFIQLLSDLSWKKAGVELTTTGQVVSASFYWRL